MPLPCCGTSADKIAPTADKIAPKEERTENNFDDPKNVTNTTGNTSNGNDDANKALMCVRNNMKIAAKTSGIPEYRKRAVEQSEVARNTLIFANLKERKLG